MATFGELVQGSINDSIPNGERKGCLFTAPGVAGTITKIWLMMAGVGSGNFRAALYSNGGGLPDVLLAQAAADTAFVNDGGTPTNRSSDVNYTFAPLEELWFSFYMDGANATVYFETGATNQQYAWFPGTGTYPTFPSPETSIYQQDYKITCWAEYTPADNIGSPIFIRKAIRPALFKPGNSR